MNLSKFRKQIVKIIFDFNYKREVGLVKYLKVILNNGKIYNCTDVELYSNNIEIQLDEELVSIKYEDIKNIIYRRCKNETIQYS